MAALCSSISLGDGERRKKIIYKCRKKYIITYYCYFLSLNIIDNLDIHKSFNYSLFFFLFRRSVNDCEQHHQSISDIKMYTQYAKNRLNLQLLT